MIGRNAVRHESFALMGFSRTHGGEKSLFGSSIKHGNTIVMRIKQAEIDRRDSSEYFHAFSTPLIEVEMSSVQFAEMITSMNVGDGVPVTLRSFNGKKMEECPFENKRQQFEQDFDKRMKNMGENLEELTVRAREVLTQKKPPTKGERDEVLHAIRMLIQEVSSNTPFMATLFNEQMEKTVHECKGEVESFIQNKITQLGMEGLRNQLPRIDGSNKQELIEVQGDDY